MASLLTGCVAAAACGASTEQQGETSECLKGCGLKAMTCLESESCMNANGELVPCEDECNRLLEECEAGC
jgi:hypothetical protein